MIDINETLKGKWVKIWTDDNRMWDGLFVDYGEGMIILQKEGIMTIVLSDKIVCVNAEEPREK